MPDTPVPVALAFSAEYFFERSERRDAMASPNSTPVRARPAAFAVPPLTPTNADREAAPIVSRSTTTSSVDVPSLTVSVLRSMPKSPVTVKNPPAVSDRLPLARSRSPSAPLMFIMIEVDGPVATTSGAAAQSTTGCDELARLISTLRLLAAMLMSASPVMLIPSRLASRAVQRFVGSARSLAIASAASALVIERPAAALLPPLRPTKAEPPSIPSVSSDTSEVLPSARVMLAADRRSANEPVTRKKSLTLTVSEPEASSSAPAAPSRLME